MILPLRLATQTILTLNIDAHGLFTNYAASESLASFEIFRLYEPEVYFSINST